IRLFGARVLPVGVNQGRLAAMGLPTDVTEHALRRVQSLRDWDLAWTWAAQCFLGEGRIHQRAGQEDAAALSQQHAALAYHLAGMLVFDDPRKIRALRASASSLYARSLPRLRPAVRRIEVPWRATHLPGYLALPENVSTPVPLAVLLNGSSTSKEETLLWSEAFLEHGLAVLALDWPGSGESSLHVAPTLDCDDLMDGVVSVMSSGPAIDATRIGLVGFSLGGAVAGLVAASDRRVGAIVAVTPPFDPRSWFTRAQPLLRSHLAALVGGNEQLTQLTGEFALSGIIGRVRCPVLVFGAGRDLIVPPEEAIRFCAAVGGQGTLLWYPDGRHGLYEELSDWTTEAARWLNLVLAGVSPSTRVEHAVVAPIVEHRDESAVQTPA
ncbi:MAG TPA: alpha/beta fold hydrolase, partial [Thermomicrobiales bacterium]|nr:alpha/beta fold hydrolase [Thermomicrobiales bacterium]